MLKRKLGRCSLTKGKRVEDFVESGLMKDIKKRLNVIHEDFQCPAEPLKKKEEDKKESKPSSSTDLGVDFSWMDPLKRMLVDNPKAVAKMFMELVKGKKLVSEEFLPVLNLVTNTVADNPEYVQYVLSFAESAEQFFRSEGGQRLFRIMPQLYNADAETAMELLATEADYHQEYFFNLVKNTDVAEGFLRSVAKFFIGGFGTAKAYMEDDMKFAVVNGMLMANKFPPIDKRNWLKSGTKIFEKILRLFTSSKEETNVYQEAKIAADEFEKLYFRFDDVSKLSDKEVENVVVRFLQDNVMDPVKDAWLAHRQVSKHNTSLTKC